jgi:beta-lactamase superfamily II metal-dependent hydrolase
MGKALGRLSLLAAGTIWAASSQLAAATDIQTSDRVVRWVNVRATASSKTATIDRLEPGEKAELIEVLPAWYFIRLPDGRTGYVSRGWTVRSDQLADFQPIYFLHLIDVGTGLAVFIEGPGFTLLYDGGSNDDTARGPRNRLTAYLRHLRPEMAGIDHVILSHPHRDHVELLPDVVGSYAIGNVWDSGRTNPICSYRAFLRLIRARQIPYHDAHGGTGPHSVPLAKKVCYGQEEPAETVVIPHASRIVEGAPIPLGTGATLTFLHADASELDSFNENSLVAMVELGRSRVLLMGDAEAGGRRSPNILPAPNSVEGELIEHNAPALRADVLVAGHHGSKTSSRTAFLDRVGAYVFLVSAGPTKYASVTLPDREVIDEFAERGTVYRTDADDQECRTNPAKIGTDNDNQPGGCSNVLVSIDPDGEIRAEMEDEAD